MTVVQFENQQRAVTEALPMLVKLEEVILIAIEIDREDGGKLEITLLRYQMTVMSSRLVLAEADAGIRDRGDDWFTPENMDSVHEAITDVVTITGEVEEDDSMNSLIEAAERNHKERQDA